MLSVSVFVSVYGHQEEQAREVQISKDNRSDSGAANWVFEAGQEFTSQVNFAP